MAVDDRLRDVDHLLAVGLGMVSQHPEGQVGVDRMPRHEDALRLLDERAPAEGALKALILRESLQGDVDRALERVGIVIHDVGEDTALRSLVHVSRVVCGQQSDHGAGGFTDDLGDQVERVLRIQPEPDEGRVWPLLSRSRRRLP